MRGKENFTCDALSRLFNKQQIVNPIETSQESDPLFLLNSLIHSNPQGFFSILNAQKRSEYCKFVYSEVQSGQNVKNFCIRDGLLCKLVGKNRLKRIVIPESMLDLILEWFHSTTHNGITKTYRDIARRFWCLDLFKISKKYVLNCKICATTKPSNKTELVKPLMTPITSVWTHLYVDYVGPLITSSEGFKYIFVCMDGFSKFLITKPTRRSTSSVTCKMLRDIFLSFGYPKFIISDNGPAFKAERYQNFLIQSAVKAVYTSPYNPGANLSERVNRNLKVNISSILKSKKFNHNKWSEILPNVTYTYNRTYHSTIDCTPASVFFGREMLTEFDQAFKINLTEEKIDMDQVTKAINDSRNRSLKQFANRPMVSSFKLDDLVLLKNLNPTSTFDTDKKFTDRFLGPYIITKVNGPSSFIIQEVSTGVVKSAHVSHLKKYTPKIQVNN